MGPKRTGACADSVASLPYGADTRGLVILACVLLGTIGCDLRVATESPVAATLTSPSDGAQRRVWTVNRERQVQSFRRGDQSAAGWTLAAPLEGEELARTESSLSAVSWNDGGTRHERVFYVGESGQLRVIALDGASRRYIVDTSLGLSGPLGDPVGLGFQGAPVLVGDQNDRVLGLLGLPIFAPPQLFLFEASSTDEQAYAARSAGSPFPTGTLDALGPLVVSKGDDGSICFFARIAGVPDRAAAFSYLAGTWTTTRIDGESTDRAFAALAWRNDQGEVRHSLFVAAESGTVYESLWSPDCEQITAWQSHGLPSTAYAGRLRTLAASLAGTASNPLVELRVTDGGDTLLSQSYVPGSAPPTVWQPHTRFPDAVSGMGTLHVFSDEDLPEGPALYALGDVGTAADSTGHLFELESASNASVNFVGPDQANVPVAVNTLGGFAFREQSLTESHMTDRAGRQVLGGMVARGIGVLRVAFGLSETDGYLWNVGVVPVSIDRLAGNVVVQGDPTTTILSDGTRLAMFHEIEVDQCSETSPSVLNNEIRMVSVEPEQFELQGPVFSPLTTPDYFKQPSRGDQADYLLDHPWMGTTRGDVVHITWLEEPRNDVPERMGYTRRLPDGTFDPANYFLDESTTTIGTGPPYLTISADEGVYIGWEVGNSLRFCRWPDCEVEDRIVKLTDQAGADLGDDRGIDIRRGAQSYAGSRSDPDHVYAAYSTQQANLPAQAGFCPCPAPRCLGTRSGATAVVFTESMDGGQTWSCARAVSDGPMDGRSEFQPTIAVQDDGTVLVTFFKQNAVDSTLVSHRVAIRNPDGTWFNGTKLQEMDLNLLPQRCGDSQRWMGDYQVAVGRGDHVHSLRVTTSSVLPNGAMLSMSAMSRLSWR